MSHRLHVEVFFDFICPWCLIGKRQLDVALDRLRSERPDVEVDLAWQGVQLLPHLPPQGEPFAEFYLQRLGSVEAVRMRQAQVQQAAAAVGVSIDLRGIERMPNTADAHRLMEQAAVLGSAAQRDALLERLFSAYFVRGEDLGCADTLLAIAEECGFDRAALAGCLSGDASPYLGSDTRPVKSVPHFQFDRRLAISGAQPAEALFGAMCEALQQERQPS
ncbi:DSBA-like thioredoxin domain protein [compost metagenome]